MQDIEIRSARAEDTEEILSFCQNTFAWGDYLPDIWDHWLTDPGGDLLVATIQNRPVGTAHCAMLSQTDAYFEAVRVHPAERRSGIGYALTIACLAKARERGATSMRAVATITNSPSIHMMEHAGFTVVGSYRSYSALAHGTTADSHTGYVIWQPGPEMLATIWTWMEHSQQIPLIGGVLFIERSRCVSLSEEQVREQLEQQHVWILEEHGAIQSMAIGSPRTRYGQSQQTFALGYLDGQVESLSRLALYMRAYAAQQGYATVDVRASDMLIVQDALNGAEFQEIANHAAHVVLAISVEPTGSVNYSSSY